jgi:hypothetical protein
VEQLGLLAVGMGEAVTAERLALYVEDLADLSQQQIEQALRRARRELKFFPKIAELRELAGAGMAAEASAEARRAWEALVKFVDRWCRWNCEYDRAYVERGAPILAQRIVDTVHRTGGWSAYLGLSSADFPFQQRRFFEEYAAWEAVEKVDMSKLLIEIPQLKLLARRMNQPDRVEPVKSPSAAPMSKPKLICESITDVQLEDRREMLRQQAEFIRQKSTHRQQS